MSSRSTAASGCVDAATYPLLLLLLSVLRPFHFRYYFSKFDCCMSRAGSRLLLMNAITSEHPTQHKNQLERRYRSQSG